MQLLINICISFSKPTWEEQSPSLDKKYKTFCWFQQNSIHAKYFHFDKMSRNRPCFQTWPSVTTRGKTSLPFPNPQFPSPTYITSVLFAWHNI